MSDRYRRWTQAIRVPLGFVLAAAFLVLSRPTPSVIVWGGIFALLGVVLRFWAAGHIEKGRVLTTTGPYAYTRNPLYLGSLIIGIGFGIVSGTFSIPLLFIAYFFLIYWPVMRQEEKELQNSFRDEFVRYAQRVPRLIPSRRPWQEEPGSSREGFQFVRAIRNREYNAVLGYIGMILLLYLKYRL